MSGTRYSKRYGYNDNYYGPSSPPVTFDRFVRGCAKFAREVERQKRAAARAQQQQVRAQERQVRDAIRASKQAERDHRAREREDARRYTESRVAEVEQMNRDLATRLDDMNGVLAHTLSIDDTIAFDELAATPPFPEFRIPEDLLEAPRPPNLNGYLNGVPKPWRILLFLPFVRRAYEEKLEVARVKFRNDLVGYESASLSHRERIATALKGWEAQRDVYLQKATELAEKVAAFEANYRAGISDSIETYSSMVLERSEYPQDFEQDFDLSYDPSSKHASVRFQLPPLEIIPLEAAYVYIKTRDEVTTKHRKASEVNALYKRLTASIALRTVHELFEADQGHFLDTVAFAGNCEILDKSTGKHVLITLVNLETDKVTFQIVNLANVDPVECLLGLGGSLRVPGR